MTAHRKGNKTHAYSAQRSGSKKYAKVDRRKRNTPRTQLWIKSPNDIKFGIQIQDAKRNIVTETDIQFYYSSNMDSIYEELKSKGVDITAPEKHEWGGE